MLWIVAVIICCVMVACASIGRPEGGPRDVDPPVFVRSNPTPGAVKVNKQNIELFFDENIKIEDAINKVVVSPAQKVTPQVIANGKRLSVELKDTLLPETTYTIDFSDAIADLNEGNVIDGFAIDFATGDVIDSLRISGMLFEARTLEPAQGIVVGCYDNLSDTAITSVPMQRITKTNQYGQFTIRGLKNRQYRVFAINDVNRDYKWDRSEDVAFYNDIVTPTVESIEVTDTLLNAAGTDSISTRPGVKYLPNDILLTWFNEGYQAQYLKNYSRPDSTKILIQFADRVDTLPQLEIVTGKNAGKKIDDKTSILNASLKLDSLEYWITDKDIIAQDSMQIAVRYLRTDTLDNLSWTTDTLRFNFLRKKIKEKKKKKNEEADSIPEIIFMDFSCQSPTTQDLNKGLLFQSSQPIAKMDENGLHLEILRDSVWTKIKTPHIVNDTVNSPLRFKADYVWEEGAKYRFTVDSAAITGIYGNWNKPVKHEFVVKTIEDYATVTFNVSGVKNFIVELLNNSDQVLRQVPVTDGVAVFDYVEPGKYYARGFIDANGNGIWDTGKLKEKLQPEEVYYYPKKLDLKKNWEVEQQWNPFELPIDTQKPAEIKKNKPKKKKGEEENNNEDEENNEEDEWGSGYNNYNNSNPYGNNNNNRNSRNNNGFNRGGFSSNRTY